MTKTVFVTFFVVVDVGKDKTEVDSKRSRREGRMSERAGRRMVGVMIVRYVFYCTVDRNVSNKLIFTVRSD